jgi:hypothetical protein
MLQDGRKVKQITPDSSRELLGVEERPDMSRDPYSKALFYHNSKEIEEYLSKKAERERIATLEKNQEQLKSDLEDIKSLLTMLINKE